MEVSKFKVSIWFTQAVLGTMPADPDGLTFIQSASKALDERSQEELDAEYDALPEYDGDLRGLTVFGRNGDGLPCLFDYQIKGLLKYGAQSMNGATIGGAKVNNFRNKIVRAMFVRPRMVILEPPEGSDISILSRPLRAETAQGPRSAIARSEMLPAGTACEFEVHILDSVSKGEVDRDMLVELLEYGQYMGIGAWRTAGYGAFDYDISVIGGGKKTKTAAASAGLDSSSGTPDSAW